MDADRFDTLLRALAERPSRRGALRTLGGLGLAGWLGLADVDAKRRKKKRRKKSKKPSPPPPPPPPPPPTCSDGIKNGNETDVDCGGSCPRCMNSRTCANRNDCLSDVCLEGTCHSCANTSQCGIDPNGQCACEATANAGSVCSPPADSIDVASCAACPVDTNCFAGIGSFFCVRACEGT